MKTLVTAISAKNMKTQRPYFVNFDSGEVNTIQSYKYAKKKEIA